MTGGDTLPTLHTGGGLTCPTEPGDPMHAVAYDDAPSSDGTVTNMNRRNMLLHDPKFPTDP